MSIDVTYETPQHNPVCWNLLQSRVASPPPGDGETGLQSGRAGGDHTLPLSVSVYMLMGGCRGLLFLHCESVVHRDLTARNVLLTSSLRAKITDFGNSRIVRLEHGQLARTLTRFPGTLVYMAPEAVSERRQYGPSLDVFSFGVLTLFVLTQVHLCMA